MTKEEFKGLSAELQDLAKIIPLQWGNIQNNSTDSKIDMFQIDSFAKLEHNVQSLTDDDKNYFRRRWFVWKCSKCDEHIFNANLNVSSNPNFKDQSYDIEFNNNKELRFDLKGTVIPRRFRENISEVLENPQEMLRFFYDEQSKGVRNHNQNRLFLVHHSFRNQDREMYLRCYWDFKMKIYSDYCSRITQYSNFYSYKSVYSDVIFIIENSDKSFTYKFFAV